jgi:hypothetical protein
MQNPSSQLSVLRTGLAASCLVVGIAGCSSGSDQPALYDRPATGAYAGSDFRGLPGTNAFRMAVLGTGEYWILHGDYSQTAFVLRGFMTGPNIAPNAGGFTAGTTFGSPIQAAANLSTLYDAYNGSVSGSITTALPTYLNFSGVYYLPAVSSLAGAWTVTDLRGININLSVAGNGQFSGTTQANCSFGGSLRTSQSVSGLVLIDIQDAFFCLGNAVAYSGVVFTEATVSTGRQQLLIAATNPQQTAGVGVYGVR